MPTSGYFWIEGTYLHYIDGSGLERGQAGTTTGATGTAGYLWIEGYNIHYIDASGNERYVPYSLIGGAGTQGYLWIEGNWVSYINETTDVKTQWHANTAHTDTHANTAHTDTHANVAHTDTHTDTHTDSYPYSDYPGCFLAGTKISMANSSSKKVEDIEIGDRVLSFYSKNKLTSASVSKLFSRLADHYYLLKTENHEINVTEEHPFYIGEEFKRIKEFSIGDKIYVLESGKLVPEKIVHKELIKKQVKIYNFRVEESQTYFANGFAVHNKHIPSDWSNHSNVAHSNWTNSVAHSNWTNSVAHVDKPGLL